MIGMYLSAFPNLHLTVDAMIGEGDIVSVLSTVTGTHTADMMGIPPTGKQIRVGGLDLIRFSGSKAVDV